MTSDERLKFVEEYVSDICLRTLYEKGEEYATEDGDVNGNFKRVAEEQGLPVLQVWNTFFQKHLDSIRNYIKNPDRPQTEPIEDRIADAINYLLILRCLIEESENENRSK